HPVLLALEVLLEGLDQAHLTTGFVERLGNHQRGQRAEIARAVGALAAALALRIDQLARPLQALRRAALLAGDLGEAATGLHRRLERPRILADVALVRRRRVSLLSSLLVQLGRLPQRAPGQSDVLPGGGNRLELRCRLERLAALEIADRELARHL